MPLPAFTTVATLFRIFNEHRFFRNIASSVYLSTSGKVDPQNLVVLSQFGRTFVCSYPNNTASTGTELFKSCPLVVSGYIPRSLFDVFYVAKTAISFVE